MSDAEASALRARALQINRELQDVAAQLAALRGRRAELEREKEECEASLGEVLASMEAQEPDGGWGAPAFPWSAGLADLCRGAFGAASFRPLQLEVMNAALSGRDVFAIMRTGAGKSLTYQAPAVLEPGFTLVVSPLLSLIEDQVAGVNRRVPGAAAALTSQVPSARQAAIHRSMSGREPSAALSLVFVTPERVAKSKRLLSALQKASDLKLLQRIVVDEAHCCSQDGHDFRTDYLSLGKLRQAFPLAPLLCCTATASPSVVNDVCAILGMAPPSSAHARQRARGGRRTVVFRGAVDRPNIHYSVAAGGGGLAELGALLRGEGFARKCGIVYCLSQNDCQRVAEGLGDYGIAAMAYHAGLEEAQRSFVHGMWCSGKTHIVVATIAFGLGVDKADVRFVVHLCCSKSLEAYYQESGRAGRDGKPARAVCFFNPATDYTRLANLACTTRAGMANLRRMAAYCMNATRCRRGALNAAMGVAAREGPGKAGAACCDVCDGGGGRAEDVTGVLKAALEHLRSAGAAGGEEERFSIKQLAQQTQRRLRAAREGLVPPLERIERAILGGILDGVFAEHMRFTAYSGNLYVAQGSAAERLRRGEKRVSCDFPAAAPRKTKGAPRKRRRRGAADAVDAASDGPAGGGAAVIDCTGDSDGEDFE